ncbi:hypothetical protein NHX12_005294 [Muraenolepis orangiensis]|uniref:Uncharacterized protein n=1 Tax=Muraenolepis orangiensis TaxID=630683 RepID=A0A9Q0DR65_9TELE|nr:hypothetical protein NHX12_005294 [Muraenolepis orangiensis]
MDAEGPFMEGGVKINHAFLEGEHHYQVTGVCIGRRRRGEPLFARKGDVLTLINGAQLNNVPPEELARLLTEGNPKLTVHQAARKKYLDHGLPGKDALQPFKKEPAVLYFSMEMRREEDLGQGKGGVEEEEEGGNVEEGDEGNQGEEGAGPVEKEPGAGQEAGCGGLLVVKLTNTSITVIKGRGCQDGCPSRDCQGTGCTFNEVVMVTNSSTVTLVPGDTCSFMMYKEMANVSLENVTSQQYLRNLFIENRPFADADSGESLLSRVAFSTCDKERLKLFYMQDEAAVAFLFYMRGYASRERTFESVLCPGWFINMLGEETVQVDQPPHPHAQNRQKESSFFFFIQNFTSHL